MITSTETSRQAVITADTSGRISLFPAGDHDHAAAVNAAEHRKNEHRDILVPAAVFVEFLNILGREAGRGAALAAASEPMSPFLIGSETVALLHSAALRKFKMVSQSVGFTDCLLMAVADGYATRNVSGFDKRFADASHRRLAPATDWKKAARRTDWRPTTPPFSGTWRPLPAPSACQPAR